jgi:hypothetical protein
VNQVGSYSVHVHPGCVLKWTTHRDTYKYRQFLCGLESCVPCYTPLKKQRTEPWVIVQCVGAVWSLLSNSHTPYRHTCTTFRRWTSGKFHSSKVNPRYRGRLLLRGSLVTGHLISKVQPAFRMAVFNPIRPVMLWNLSYSSPLSQQCVMVACMKCRQASTSSNTFVFPDHVTQQSMEQGTHNSRCFTSSAVTR